MSSIKDNTRCNLPPKAYRRLANRVVSFCEQYRIPTWRFAELAEVPNASLVRVLEQSGSITVGDWNRINGLAHRHIPPAVAERLMQGVPQKDLPEHREEKAAYVAPEATDQPQEEAPAMAVDIEFFTILRGWLDQYMISQEALSKHLGKHGPFLSFALRDKLISAEMKEQLLAMITAPGLPPRQIMTKAPSQSHSHIPETERMKRYWSLREAYDRLEAEEKERTRQQRNEEAKRRQAERHAAQTQELVPMIEAAEKQIITTKEQTQMTQQGNDIAIQLHEKLWEQLSKDAKEEFRTPDQQAAWIIHRYYQRPEAWQPESPASRPYSNGTR